MMFARGSHHDKLFKRNIMQGTKHEENVNVMILHVHIIRYHTIDFPCYHYSSIFMSKLMNK